MRRREFIGIVGGATVRLLIVGGASAAAASRVVMLSIAADPSSRLGEFRKQMNELGYAEGRNITIEFRSAEGRIERLPALAETLVREEKADVILAESTPAAVAAHQATQTGPGCLGSGCHPRSPWRQRDRCCYFCGRSQSKTCGACARTCAACRPSCCRRGHL